MEGWIKLYRKFLDWEWYNDINVCRVFLHLLLIANHEDKKWKGITILKGQVLTSINHLAKETKLTIQSVRTALNKLKSTNEITIKATSKYTLITIENYINYQIKEKRTNKESNEESSKQITNNQQTSNKPITTNKNVKNIKNEKNVTTTVSDSCVDGLQKIVDFYNNNIGMIAPYGLEVLSDYANKMQIDLVILAMKKAVEANKRTIQYIKGILNNWYKKGIKTILEAEKEDEQFRSKNVIKEETEEEKRERIEKEVKEMEERVAKMNDWY